MILKSLNEHNSLPRREVNTLLMEYLPARDERLNVYKIGNLLAKLKREKKIHLNGSGEREVSK